MQECQVWEDFSYEHKSHLGSPRVGYLPELELPLPDGNLHKVNGFASCYHSYYHHCYLFRFQDFSSN